MDQNEIETIDKNIDIDEAIKEFKRQKIREELQKPKDKQKPKNSKMAEWLVRYKIVANEEQASYVLLVFAVVVFLFSLYIFFTNIKGNKPEAMRLPPVLVKPSGVNN